VGTRLALFERFRSLLYAVQSLFYFVAGIYERKLEILRGNYRVLSQWIRDEPMIKWVPPKAGSIAFFRYNLNIPSKDLCLRLVREKGTLLTPGWCFDMEGFLRIGYGCKTKILETGLPRIKDFINSFEK